MAGVIIPIEITEANLAATNVPENDHPEWSATATYAQGDRVMVVAQHKTYQSAADANAGNDPTVDDGTWWAEVGATNRWKAFDRKISDPVVQAGTVSYTIAVDSIATGVGLLGLEASQVRVEVYDQAGNKTYDEVIALVDDTEVIDWLSYFTWQPGYDSEALFPAVPGYSGHSITVTVGDGTGTAKVGQVVVGKVEPLGTALDGTSVGIRDFSVKERDAWGNAVLVERAYVDETSLSLAIPTDDVRRVKRLLGRIRATPALYFAAPDRMRLGATVYGFFQDFSIPLSADGTSFATIEIEGLT